MIEIDVESESVLMAAELLASKVGVCEVAPMVRFYRTRFDEKRGDYKFRVGLVCVHPDASLNCGTGAEHCDNCQNKERVAEASRKFDKGLADMARNLL